MLSPRYGARQLETVPDHVFDAADEVKLVDLRPTICCSACARTRLRGRSGADGAAEFLPQGQPDRAARDGVAQDRRSRRSGDASLPSRKIGPRRLGRARTAAGGRGTRCAGRAAGARGQASGRWPRCRVAGGVRRNAEPDPPVAGRAQSPHRHPAPRSVTGRRGDHPWRLLGQRGAARVRPHTQCHSIAGGRSHRTRWRRLFRPRPPSACWRRGSISMLW